MGFDENAQMIHDYNEWTGNRRRELNDLTPEAYLKDKMKQEAADRLLLALEYIETIEPDDNHEDALVSVENILRGNL